MTIEGGAVFKYPDNPTAYLRLSGPVTCKTSGYRPAFFTAADDRSIGDWITSDIWSGVDPNGVVKPTGYANPALELYYQGSRTLSHLRFKHCKEALRITGAVNGNTLWHAQLVNCIKGIVTVGCAGCGCCYIPITVNNALFAHVDYQVRLELNNGVVNFYQCTFDAAQTLVTRVYTPSAANFYNSVFSDIPTLYAGSPTLSGQYNGFYKRAPFGSQPYWDRGTTEDAKPFLDAVAGGAYYLKASAPGFKDLGTSMGLPAGLLADLGKRTTTPPPPPLTETIGAQETWNTEDQVPRDTEPLDLGYHYEPLDRLVNGVQLNSLLTLGDGFVVGVMGDYGIELQSSGDVSSTGTATTPNRFCFYGNVQESVPVAGNAALLRTASTLTGRNLQFRFTEFAMRPGAAVSSLLDIQTGGSLAGGLSFRDCLLSGCRLWLTAASCSGLAVSLTNNVVEFSDTSFTSTSEVTYTVSLCNNLFYSNPARDAPFGIIYVDSDGNPTWCIKDNLFCGTAQAFCDPGSHVAASHNNFASGSSPGFGTDAYTRTASFLSGPLGHYYQATTTLQDLGSRSAAAADLAYYTTRMGEVEKVSMVDIGVHYKAMWTPEDLPPGFKPRNWYRAEDTEVEGASSIAAWRDAGWANWPAYKVEGGNAQLGSALNGWPVATFEVIASYGLSLPKANPNEPPELVRSFSTELSGLTLVAVAKYEKQGPSVGNNAIIFSLGADGNGWHGLWASRTVENVPPDWGYAGMRAPGGSPNDFNNDNNDVPASSSDAYDILVAEFNHAVGAPPLPPNRKSFYLNGASAHSQDTFTAGGKTIESYAEHSARIGVRANPQNPAFIGKIAEIIVFASPDTGIALLPDHRELLEGYLAHKYGLQAHLPDGHDHKATPPPIP